MNPKDMTRIVGGVRYDTRRATLIAHDAYWDGHNHERNFRNRFLYRAGSRYFLVIQTLWLGERDLLQPVDAETAQELYEGPLCEHEVPYEEAFPHVRVVDAADAPDAPDA